MADTDLSPEEKLQRYRRAKEVLRDAGWVFDEYVNARMADLMRANPDDEKTVDRLLRSAQVAAQLKIALLREVDAYDDEVTMQEHREKMKGSRNGHGTSTVN